MTQSRLLLTSSPHVLGSESIQRIMYTVLAALIPAAVAGGYFFGAHAIWLMVACMVTAVGTEALFQMARRKPVSALDGSALVTGLLLALNLPPALPIWMAVLGTAFAISLGKQVFGGLGTNAFNPALLGRAFLAAAFPVHMTTWGALGGVMADAVTSATPLKLLKMLGVMTPIAKLFF
jgi:electron transport complex protein RnfD